MQLKLLSLKLTNFKGARNRQITFNENITNIYGRNRSGKTTVFDAYRWLMTGKNSQDAKEFQIKPLDENNDHLQREDYSVEGLFSQDGIHITFKRVLRERWETPRGQAEEVFKGNETVFYYNGVKVSQTDYLQKVKAIVSEDMLKLLSDPFYFNNLNWEIRRKGLFSMLSHITDESIAAGFPEFEKIINYQKDLEQYKRMLVAKKKQIQEQKNELPIRINELQNQTVELESQTETLDVLQEKINDLSQQLKEVDGAIADINQSLLASNAQKMLQSQALNTAKMALNNFEFSKKQEFQKSIMDEKAQYNDLVSSASNAQRKVDNVKASIVSENFTLKSRSDALDKFRVAYDKKEAEKMAPFDEDELKCRECGRLLEGDDLEKVKESIISKFNNKKADELRTLSTQGKNAFDQLEAKKQEIATLQSQLTAAESQLAHALSLIEAYVPPDDKVFDVSALQESDEYKSLLAEVERLEIAIGNTIPTEETQVFIDKRRGINIELDGLKRKKTIHETITRNKERIGAMVSKEKDLAQEIADVERNQYTLSEFTKLKVNTLEGELNKKFEGVFFKMYETQVNGEIIECCETLVNGVPFPDVNHADQVNAGITIINAFSLHYDQYLPLWIDNAESCNTLRPTATQLIRLVVTEDAELIIN